MIFPEDAEGELCGVALALPVRDSGAQNKKNENRGFGKLRFSKAPIGPNISSILCNSVSCQRLFGYFHRRMPKISSLYKFDLYILYRLPLDIRMVICYIIVTKDEGPLSI